MARRDQSERLYPPRPRAAHAAALPTSLEPSPRPASIDFSRFGEQCSWTDEERQAANTRSINATQEVEDYAMNISVAFSHLNEAFTKQRLSLVGRLRVIDDRLLA